MVVVKQPELVEETSQVAVVMPLALVEETTSPVPEAARRQPEASPQAVAPLAARVSLGQTLEAVLTSPVQVVLVRNRPPVVS